MKTSSNSAYTILKNTLFVKAGKLLTYSWCFQRTRLHKTIGVQYPQRAAQSLTARKLFAPREDTGTSTVLAPSLRVSTQGSKDHGSSSGGFLLDDRFNHLASDPGHGLLPLSTDGFRESHSRPPLRAVSDCAALCRYYTPLVLCSLVRWKHQDYVSTLPAITKYFLKWYKPYWSLFSSTCIGETDLRISLKAWRFD